MNKIRFEFRTALFALVVLLCALTLQGIRYGFPAVVVRASDESCTALIVDNDKVRICRDSYGVPHIFAETNKALFQGFGYADAQDRLWQLELFRRAATGRLAEILGATLSVTNLGSVPPPTALSADLDIRTRFYNEEQLGELSEQFAMLTFEERQMFTAYADGINRYLADVVAPDQAHKLPFEFQSLGIGMPAGWTALDVVANAIYQSRFGQVGGTERQNQTLLNSLISKYCPDPGKVCEAAWGVFNDIRWKNDPDAPVSVPSDGAIAAEKNLPLPRREQLVAGSPDVGESLEEQANAALTALGVPIRLGSHAWAIAPFKSANGSPMLFGGPQISFNTPELAHEVQLKGGSGFNVIGAAVAGVPAIFLGRTDHIAWSITTGTFGDNRDTYIETLCNGGAGYMFKGSCISFETHTETIKVKGSADVTCTVRRTVHGPVTVPACNQTWPTSGQVFSQKRVVWGREIESTRAQLAINRAKNRQDFTAAVQQMEVAFNLIYADASGNIAYFLAGNVPIRRETCSGGDPVTSCVDPRLPLPGDGTAEWTGDYQPMPFSVNPVRGWLSSWNTKPTREYPNPDNRSQGKQWRSLEIDQRLANGTISIDDMKDIARDIARTDEGGDGRESRYVLPYLLDALRMYPATHPFANDAISVLERWDGVHFDDAVSSQNLAAGWKIFSTWLKGVPTNTPCSNKTFPGILCYIFADDVPGFDPNNTSSLNMLIHVLDDDRWGIGRGSGVPPSRNYFNGCDLSTFTRCDPAIITSKAFDLALAALGSETAWSTGPRGIFSFRHTLYPAVPEIGQMLIANHGTYAFAVVLGHPKPTSESIITLGQSGFIGFIPPTTPVFDMHFSDQFELYKAFNYRSMNLFDNAESAK
jgi:penicillin G amidase